MNNLSLEELDAVAFVFRTFSRPEGRCDADFSSAGNGHGQMVFTYGVRPFLFRQCRGPSMRLSFIPDTAALNENRIDTDEVVFVITNDGDLRYSAEERDLSLWDDLCSEGKIIPALINDFREMSAQQDFCEITRQWGDVKVSFDDSDLMITLRGDAAHDLNRQFGDSPDRQRGMFNSGDTKDFLVLKYLMAHPLLMAQPV